MPSNTELWQRVRDFEIDHSGTEFPFSARLARENAWPRDKALAAIGEYKRFIYLICVSPSPLTPSEAVDQVWHLHLVYTRSYWAMFCGGALGRQIHHEPTAGGELQVLRFREQYARTCALYEAEFGCAPPAEFWPSVSERFAAAPSLQWVDLRRYWVVPKPTGFGSILCSAAVAPLVLLTSCADRSSGDGSPTSDGSLLWPILWIAGVLAVAGYNSYKAAECCRDDADERPERNGWSWHFGGSGDGDGCGGCGGCGG
jgi:hypothetical protein